MPVGKALAFAILAALAACKEATPVAAAAPPDAGQSQTCEDAWLRDHKLNEYGDPPGTMYTGGTPLFDEKTGKSQDKKQYLYAKLPELRSACTR